METIVKKVIKHDYMTFSAKFNSGASLKYRISFESETLILAFSNDPKILKKQTKIVNEWLDKCCGKDNQTTFDKLELLCKKYQTGSDVIKEMEKDLEIKSSSITKK